MQMPYIQGCYHLLSSLCRSVPEETVFELHIFETVMLILSCWMKYITNSTNFHRGDIKPFLQCLLYNLKLNLTLITPHQIYSNIPHGKALIVRETVHWMESEYKWRTCDWARIPKMAGMKALLKGTSKSVHRGCWSNRKPLQNCTVMSNNGTNNELKERGMIPLIWIRLRESHVKYRVSANLIYSVTGASGMAFCSEGMAR